jgi:hypothetical protein
MIEEKVIRNEMKLNRPNPAEVAPECQSEAGARSPTLSDESLARPSSADRVPERSRRGLMYRLALIMPVKERGEYLGIVAALSFTAFMMAQQPAIFFGVPSKAAQ